MSFERKVLMLTNLMEWVWSMRSKSTSIFALSVPSFDFSVNTLSKSIYGVSGRWIGIICIPWFSILTRSGRETLQTSQQSFFQYVHATPGLTFFFVLLLIQSCKQLMWTYSLVPLQLQGFTKCSSTSPSSIKQILHCFFVSPFSWPTVFFIKLKGALL